MRAAVLIKQGNHETSTVLPNAFYTCYRCYALAAKKKGEGGGGGVVTDTLAAPASVGLASANNGEVCAGGYTTVNDKAIGHAAARARKHHMRLLFAQGGRTHNPWPR